MAGSKKIKYEKERNEIFDKINKILEVENEQFLGSIIYNNENKQNQIYNLEQDIKLYFRCSNWSYFRSDRTSSKPYISLVKNIYRDMGHDLICQIKTNDKIYHIKKINK